MAYTNLRLSTTIEGIADLMNMTKDEVRFFPKLEEIRGILKDYNYSVISERKAAEKITGIKEKLGGDEIIFIPGLEALIAKFIY